jgi:hypothetical protein
VEGIITVRYRREAPFWNPDPSEWKKKVAGTSVTFSLSVSGQNSTSVMPQSSRSFSKGMPLIICISAHLLSECAWWEMQIGVLGKES